MEERKGHPSTKLEKHPLFSSSLFPFRFLQAKRFWPYAIALPKTWTAKAPNHILPSGLYAVGWVFNCGFRRDSYFVELADGGHFDDLGLYELVRKKLSLIVILDGEADRTTGYAALVSVTQRVAEDFGHKLLLCDKKGKGPDRLVPDQPMLYPGDAKRADHPWLAAHAIYYNKPGGTPEKYGTIIYIKATMIAGLSFKVNGYKGKNPEFPHQTTADQFFDPEQFEAYRELGYVSMIKALEEVDLDQARDDPQQFWTEYCRSRNKRPAR